MYYTEQTKHKVFFSFYHYDDQGYKDYIDKHLSSGILNKSVKTGEYDPDESDLYIKRLIREDKVSDSSVVVVLVGPNTRKRKHVDWEIYAGLRASVNGSSGLIGVLLPEFKLDSDGNYYLRDLPARLADNVYSGYADIYLWDDFKKNFITIINEVYKNKIIKRDRINNNRVQMKRNLGTYE